MKHTEPNQIGERVYRGATVRDIAEAIVEGVKAEFGDGKGFLPDENEYAVVCWAESCSHFAELLRGKGKQQHADDLALLASEIRAVWTE